MSAASVPLFASLLATTAMFLCVWLVSLAKADVGMVDIVWGPGFALIAWLQWLWMSPSHASATLLLLAVTLWAARLGAHLFMRHRISMAEDARYAAMRSADPACFWWQSLYKVFVLQAVILWALALPIHLAMLAAATGLPGWRTAVGLVLFGIGFMMEAIADHQCGEHGF